MRLFLALLFLSCAGVIGASEDGLRAEVQQYLAANSTPSEGLRWMKKWRDTSEQMQKDNSFISGEQAAANLCLLRYAAERCSKLKPGEVVKLTKEEKIEFCRFYILYQLRGWDLPERLEAIANEYVAAEKAIPAKSEARAEK